jgi:hypothetical protein
VLVTQAQVRARIIVWTDSTHDPVLADPADIDILAEMALKVDLYGNIPDRTAEWVSKTYSVGDQVVPVGYAGDAFIPIKRNGYYYTCTVGGVSGLIQPTFPTVVGATVVDGAVTWSCTGTSPWNPTYDVNYAIAQGWLLKSTRLVGHYNYMANGKMLSREQMYAHAMKMYRLFTGKSGVKAVRLGNHDPLSLELMGGGTPTNSD